MQLHFVSRGEYRQRGEMDYLKSVCERFGPCVIVPEGGANSAGVAGCREIVPLLNDMASDWDVIAVACGTGATLAGIACELVGERQALGISVLKGQGSRRRDVARWIIAQGGPPRDNWRIEQDFHAGGYARTTAQLRQFMLEFERVQGIPLDHVYTGKLFHALYKMRSAGLLPRPARVIAVHSGGLQGRRGADWLHAGTVA
jgi:1-aminocyclopropane-1-carboxylate deaminase